MQLPSAATRSLVIVGTGLLQLTGVVGFVAAISYGVVALTMPKPRVCANCGESFAEIHPVTGTPAPGPDQSSRWFSFGTPGTKALPAQ
jgi:hypothetical protein